MKYYTIITIFSLYIIFMGCKSMDEYHKLEDATYISEYEDKKIMLTGKISHIPWQHMIKAVQSHPYMEYFDVGDDQIVFYSIEQIDCKSTLTLYGTVIKVEGKSKRPGSDDIYTEYHLLVDKWQCF